MKEKTKEKSLETQGFYTSCGRWDLNPHDIAITRSLVLLVCQFRHFRIAVNRCKKYNSIMPSESQQQILLFFKICPNGFPDAGCRQI